jgi:hypothetical protein
MISTKTQREAECRALALGFLAAALMAVCLLLLTAANPAHAATTFTVNSTRDVEDNNRGDGSCFTGVFIQVGPRFARECTLRAAMEENNANDNGATVVDVINFNISGSSVVKTIIPASALPTITERVVIDGYTQPGASVNTRANGDNAILKIQLNGATTTSSSGLRIEASNSLVKGLVINRFSGGISIGGDNNTINGNFIGTNPAGTIDRGNIFEGVFIGGSNNTVGGTSPAARNLISGNGEHGFEASGSGNDVLGNFIGTDHTGAQDLGNDRSGVSFSTGNHMVGGDTAASANVIAFNGHDGVVVVNSFSTGNSILRNSISSNGGLGIDLGDNGSTANDPGDADTGPNNLQNFPVLASAQTVGDTTTIKGRLNSTPATAFEVRLFSNPSDAEGKTFIGQMGVTTNASGNTGTFTFTSTQAVSVGQNITATATDSGGNTSEYSAPREVTAS